jgi:hypothetical protein
LGQHATEGEAALRYNQEAMKLFGVFAKLNDLSGLTAA